MPSIPQIHEPPRRPQACLYGIGLALLAANKVRRTFRPYDRPRPWRADRIDRSVTYIRDLMRNWEIGFGEAGVADWLAGRHVLELGPGPDLGTGLALLARGAASYVGVDRFPLLGGTPPAFYDALLESLAGEPEVWRAVAAYQRFQSGDPGGDLRYVLLGDVRAGAAPRSPAPPADLWLSHATLEHVAEPGPLLRMLGGWCREGAVALHHVDAATHTPWIRDADPLNILRYGERLYGALAFPGSPNRWRAGRFVDCFREIGWELIDDQPVHRLSGGSLAAVRPHLSEEFRRMDAEQLAVYSFRLVLRKKTPGPRC